LYTKSRRCSGGGVFCERMKSEIAIAGLCGRFSAVRPPLRRDVKNSHRTDSLMNRRYPAGTYRTGYGIAAAENPRAARPILRHE